MATFENKFCTLIQKTFLICPRNYVAEIHVENDYKIYYGAVDSEFKFRYINHTKSFKSRYYEHDIELQNIYEN